MAREVINVGPTDARAGDPQYLMWAKVNRMTDELYTAVDVTILEGVMADVSADITKIANTTNGEYETVAASQTAQILGPTGATGDFVSHVLVIPATTSPGAITLLDGATSITIFAGGSGAVATLTPFPIPLQMYSVNGPWKLTTGADVSCVAVGNFT